MPTPVPTGMLLSTVHLAVAFMQFRWTSVYKDRKHALHLLPSSAPLYEWYYCSYWQC
jgi:hypothetical protein